MKKKNYLPLVGLIFLTIALSARKKRKMAASYGAELPSTQ